MTSPAAEQEAYNELCCYTLAHGDPAFIHQHVVDAYAAQHATAQSRPISVTFALVGLYLHVEKNVAGKRVQRIHMQLGRRKHQWPVFLLPRDRGTITAVDVMAAAAGAERDRAIDAWCQSVWAAFRNDHRQTIIELLRRHQVHD